MKKIFIPVLFGLLFISCQPEKSNEEVLIDLLGNFPERPDLNIDTLETVQLEKGIRYKIKYLSEPAGGIFDEPVDWINAYLFVPNDLKSETNPAIIAIHQDGANTHLGKLETAGLAGEDDMHYGLELFERGYIVLCPDRMYHAERRRIDRSDTVQISMERDDKLLDFWAGQLLSKGRTVPGKTAYDLSRAVDVLYKLEIVDKEKIGAIGHSGGGVALLYFMAVDKRVKFGVSSCGIAESIDFFNQNSPQRFPMVIAIPGLANFGSNADYLALIAPRPMLLTRGSHEFGGWDEEVIEKSKWHVESTKKLVRKARVKYSEIGESDNLEVIYFDENNGYHSFPPNIKNKVYEWIDKQMDE